ncbi:cardiolipin synthase [Deltaproteobacteria bacterium]|nr:cardiolipin synthase [Deltaproteobacteria bacterium]
MPVSAEWVLVAVQVGLAGIAAGFAVARRRGPHGTLAWLFAIVAFPLVGPLAYFALANPHISRPKRRKIQAAERVRGENPPAAAPPEAVFGTPAVRSVLKGMTRATLLPPTTGNQVTLLTDNVAAFAAKELAIREAKHSVWAEYYSLHDDATGRRFLEALRARAAEGVEVRLLVDAVGSHDIDEASVARLRAAGGRVEAFHPVNPLRRRWSVHLRNHRKVLVVDGAIGFVGGMNIGDRYAGSGRRRSLRWRDTHLRIEGPAARDLARVFDEDWCFMTGECLRLADAAPAKGNTTVAVLPSGPDQPENAAALAWFSCIGLAVERCWLTTPYFAPNSAILTALTSAARRGVDVRLLVPVRTDLWLMDLVNRSFYPALVEAGVRVFEYQPAFVHAKTLVADTELSFIGSANVDIRSFQLNFEAGAVIADPGFAGQMERQFLADLEESREVSVGAVRRGSVWAAASQGAAQVLAPLL